MNSGVYRILNTVTGEKYIGSSARYSLRKCIHLCNLRRGDHTCSRLQKSFDKHGESAFVFELVEPCPQSRLERREQAWVKKEKPEFNGNRKTYRAINRSMHTATVSFTCQQAMVTAIDRYVAAHRQTSRGAAVRRMIEMFLETDGCEVKWCRHTPVPR